MFHRSPHGQDRAGALHHGLPRAPNDAYTPPYSLHGLCPNLLPVWADMGLSFGLQSLRGLGRLALLTYAVALSIARELSMQSTWPKGTVDEQQTLLRILAGGLSAISQPQLLRLGQVVSR